jgi:prepilin-type N-terminal cleavage/methylation domain-containing protein
MRNRRSGLSLVELLAVVAIMAIVAGMLLSTMRAVWKIVKGWRADAATSVVAMTNDEIRMTNE